MTLMHDKEAGNPRDFLYSKILSEYFGSKDRRAYGQSLRRRLVSEFGGCCIICKSKDKLQFAHMDDTKILSTGRGMILRYTDIILNKKFYRLLCLRCHAIFDVIRISGGMSREDALGLLKELIAEDENITLVAMMRFDGEKFVLKGNYYLRVKKK